MLVITSICACTDVSNFKYKSVKILLLQLGSELPNLVEKIPIHSEDMNKMQTEFWRSAMYIPHIVT